MCKILGESKYHNNYVHNLLSCPSLVGGSRLYPYDISVFTVSDAVVLCGQNYMEITWGGGGGTPNII